MFVDAKGNQAQIGQFDDKFTERLTQIKMLKPHLFEPGLNIVEAYSLRRSLRQVVRGVFGFAVEFGITPPHLADWTRWYDP
jgi:hypothetical protein